MMVGVGLPLALKHGQVCITSEDFFNVSTLPVRAVVHRSALWFAPLPQWGTGRAIKPAMPSVGGFVLEALLQEPYEAITLAVVVVAVLVVLIVLVLPVALRS